MAPNPRVQRTRHPLGGLRRMVGLLSISGMVGLYGVSVADWVPPRNPNPEKILDEAEADTAAGRYSDALAKHLWFHQNALTYAPAMYGVRLSFALSSWGTLACLYPPALERMKAVRDEAAVAVREDGNPRRAFHDFTSINEKLEEEARTTQLFLWLDENDPRRAAQVFDIAQAALVEQRHYRVCGKYLDLPRSVERMMRQYRENLEFAEDPDLGDMKSFAEESFAYQAATLVALLVLNDRKADAERVATSARAASGDLDLARKLDAALKGTCPARWP